MSYDSVTHNAQNIPEVDMDAEFGPSFSEQTWRASVVKIGERNPEPIAQTVNPPTTEEIGQFGHAELDDPAVFKLMDVVSGLDNLKLTQEQHDRFHGQSSTLDFIKDALSARKSTTSEQGTTSSARVKFWLPAVVRQFNS